MKEKYDVIVIGMGPSSIFLAYELIQLGKNKRILLIEQGKRIENRNCPIEKTKKCEKRTKVSGKDSDIYNVSKDNKKTWLRKKLLGVGVHLNKQI